MSNCKEILEELLTEIGALKKSNKQFTHEDIRRGYNFAIKVMEKKITEYITKEKSNGN